MGSIFSSLTKPGVQQPSGATTNYDNPAQATQALAAASAATAAPNTSSVDGTIGPDGSSTVLANNNAQAPVAAQPKIVNPTWQQAQEKPELMTKGGKLLSLLQTGLEGAARGAAAGVPTNPHISPGLGPSLAAGVETPFAMKQQQLEQEKESGQNTLLRAQSDMVPTPYGPMPGGMAKMMFPAMIKAGATTTAATTAAGAKRDVADTQSQTAQDVADTRAAATRDTKRYIASPAGMFDTQTREMVPQTQQGVTITPDMAKQYGMPAEFVGRPMNVSQLAQVERAQAAQAGTTTNTVDFKDDGQGNIVALPKTTTTKKNLPGAAPASTPAPTAGASGGSPKVVISGKSVPMSFGTDSDGNQVAGTPSELKSAGVSNFSPLGTAESAKVNIARQLVSPSGLFALADKDLAKFKPGELEALAPRWNEFLAGKVGTADPRYVALRTHVNGLLSTALMQAHMGARGGEHIMEHFQDMANAGTMSKETLQAALGAEKEYVQDKAMRPKAQSGSSGNGAPPPSKPKGSFFSNIPGATAIQGPQ